MPRTFDGTDDVITHSAGNCNFVANISFAAIVKRNSTNTNAVMGFDTSGGAIIYEFGIQNSLGSNVLYLWNGTDTPSAGGPITNSSNWVFVGISKATGFNAPRFHDYVYDTNTWGHANAGISINDSSGTVGAVTIGEADGSLFGGDIAVVGAWNRVLTDGEFEALAFSLQAWYASAPNGLWVLDQGDTANNNIDLTGGGANQSGITGTAVGTNSISLFNYGIGPIVRRGIVAGGGSSVPVKNHQLRNQRIS